MSLFVYFSFSGNFISNGIDAKDIEEQLQANLDVFGVYVVIRLCRCSNKQTRLSMLGVINTEHFSRCNFLS